MHLRKLKFELQKRTGHPPASEKVAGSKILFLLALHHLTPNSLLPASPSCGEPPIIVGVQAADGFCLLRNHLLASLNSKLARNLSACQLILPGTLFAVRFGIGIHCSSCGHFGGP